MKVQINSLPKTTGMKFYKKNQYLFTTMILYQYQLIYSKVNTHPTLDEWVKQHLGQGKQSEVNVWFFLHLSDICLYRTHKDLLVFLKYICKCCYKARKLLASILKHGIPTFGFLKCLQLFKKLSHDTCRVLGLKNKQIFTRCKALEGGLYHIRSVV